MGKQLEIDFDTIKTKTCTKCGVEKNIEEFGKHKKTKDGLNHLCKKCNNEKSKIYRESENHKENHRKYLNEYNKEYRKTEKRKEYLKEYYKSEKNKEYRNSEKRKEYEKEYNKKYRELNKNLIKQNKKEYKNNRLKTDELFKLKFRLTTSISRSFKNKGFKKNSRTQEILGCTVQDFKLYLESKFEPWMNWNNYGKYNGTLNYGFDIDHIIPLSTAKTEEDIIRLNHYTNLQPLCSHTNRNIKRNKML